MDKKKTPKISQIQLEAMLGFFEENRSLISSGSFKSGETKMSRDLKWEELGTLMAKFGDVRNSSSWKKCWLDVKKGCRNAMAKLRQSVNTTGGPGGLDAMKLLLTPVQQRISALLGDDSIVGMRVVNLPVSYLSSGGHENVSLDSEKMKAINEESINIPASEIINISDDDVISVGGDVIEQELHQSEDTQQEPQEEKEQQQLTKNEKVRPTRKRYSREITPSTSLTKKSKRARDVAGDLLTLMKEQRDSTLGMCQQLTVAVNANTTALQKILKAYCDLNNVEVPE